MPRHRINIDRDDVNVVAAVNMAKPGTTAETSSKQHVEVVQNGKRTTVKRTQTTRSNDDRQA
jgi:hypothetical protein